MILFKGCDVFSPHALGKKDVLAGGGKILAIENSLQLPALDNILTLEAGGLTMLPGLIDGHIHIAGAGGEGGPRTRTAELELKQMLEGGITTVVGCLGTDGFTRNVESVLMKAKALRHSGVSAWIYTGAYQVPTPTITGDIGKDIAVIEEVIGVGEIALADNRSSAPSVDELIRLTAHARIGGMLGDKAGIVSLHMGDATNPFEMIYRVVQMSELSLQRFLPTHCNRNHYIFEDAKTYGKEGFLDLTTSSYDYYPEVEVKPSEAVVRLCKAGVPAAHISMSSDACGSLPVFDGSGNLIQLNSGEPKTLFNELRDMVKEEGLPMDQAVRFVTSNVADILKLKKKGRIKIKHDADLLLVDKDFNIRHLIANGQLKVRDGDILTPVDSMS